MSQKIYIRDEVTTSFVRMAELRDAYFARYVPEARQRGMTLEGAWRSPPGDIPGRDSTLHVLWSVQDAPAWWAMRLADVEGKSLWWNFVDSIATDRKRTVMAGLTEDVRDV